MKEWKTISLGELGRFTNGINKSAEDFGHGVPFVNLLDIFGVSTLSEIPEGLVNAREEEVARYNLQFGDVLFVRSSVKPSGVGLTAIILRDLPRTVFSGFLIRFRPSYSHCVPDYLGHCFHGGEFRTSLLSQCTVSANTNINQERLKALSIQLPPIPEQTKIAEILSTVDRAIEQTEALIAKQQRIKAALMQDLLTRGIDEHGNLRSESTHKFKDSLLGRIPVEWEVVPLSHYVARLDAGVSVNSDDTPCGSGQIGVLKTSALNKGRFLPEQNKSVIREDLMRVRIPLRSNTVLISRMNTPALVGESAYIERDYPELFLPDRIWMTVFQEGKEAAAMWIGFVLTSPAARNYISLNATGTSGSMKNLPKKSLLTMPMASPNTLEEVDRITQVLFRFDKRDKENASRFSKLNSLKTALMQDLLTGRKRVAGLLLQATEETSKPIDHA